MALEAILLTCFLLMAQNRMTQQADHRAHLDLQINLLAEQELTAILTLQCLLAERAGIDVSRVERLDQLRTRTDVHRLAATIARELEAVQAAPDLDEADGAPRRSATREVGAAEVDNGTRGQRREP